MTVLLSALWQVHWSPKLYLSKFHRKSTSRDEQLKQKMEGFHWKLSISGFGGILTKPAHKLPTSLPVTLVQPAQRFSVEESFPGWEASCSCSYKAKSSKSTFLCDLAARKGENRTMAELPVPISSTSSCNCGDLGRNRLICCSWGPLCARWGRGECSCPANPPRHHSAPPRKQSSLLNTNFLFFF